eukprot:gene24868-31257_t
MTPDELEAFLQNYIVTLMLFNDFPCDSPITSEIVSLTKSNLDAANYIADLIMNHIGTWKYHRDAFNIRVTDNLLNYMSANRDLIVTMPDPDVKINWPVSILKNTSCALYNNDNHAKNTSCNPFYNNANSKSKVRTTTEINPTTGGPMLEWQKAEFKLLSHENVTKHANDSNFYDVNSESAFNRMNSIKSGCSSDFFRVTGGGVQSQKERYLNQMQDNLLPATDLLIVAIGAWYKPLFIHRFQNDIDYNKSYSLSIDEMNSTQHTTREYVLKNINPQAKFIWRLQPHAGNLDEIKYFNESLLDGTMTHDNGSAWSDTSRLASWVTPYNRVISSVASQYNDSVVDWFTLSMQYITHFNSLGVSTHADSLHWCPASLPRGGNLLLQDAVREAYL